MGKKGGIIDPRAPEKGPEVYTVIECSGGITMDIPGSDAYGFKAVRLVHGEDLTGREIIAVYLGKLHTGYGSTVGKEFRILGECAWCDELRSRCKSRRVA
jgi:hypothetical protein